MSTGQGHFITRCKECDTVINQCRCFDHSKELRYDICDNCKKLVEEKEEKTKTDVCYVITVCSECGRTVDGPLSTHVLNFSDMPVDVRKVVCDKCFTILKEKEKI